MECLGAGADVNAAQHVEIVFPSECFILLIACSLWRTCRGYVKWRSFERWFLACFSVYKKYANGKLLMTGQPYETLIVDVLVVVCVRVARLVNFLPVMRHVARQSAAPSPQVVSI